MMKLKRKPPYSQSEIAEQIGHVGTLIEQRDKLRYPEDMKRANQSVESAQEVLNFMIEEVRHWQNKH